MPDDDKQKHEKARREINAASQELDRLLKQSQQGTLDRKTLEAGLEKARLHVDDIPDHHK